LWVLGSITPFFRFILNGGEKGAKRGRKGAHPLFYGGVLPILAVFPPILKNFKKKMKKDLVM